MKKSRCESLVEEVERLSAERDKLMDIGNSLRAELNRALSNSFEVRCTVTHKVATLEGVR